MKTIITTSILIVLAFTNLKAQESINKRIEEARTKQLELRNSQDEDTWFKEKIDYDLNNDSETIVMTKGVYNYPKYSLISDFSGLGTGGRASVKMPITLGNKEIVYSFLTMNKNELYPEVTSDGQVFFALITVADVQASNYKAMANVSSRNHPDYLGEGFIRSEETQIDYIAFTTPDKGNFAIVNNRIFDLSHGSIILIAPQKDGTLRSMQLKEDPQIVNSDAKTWEELKFDNFVREDLLKRDKINDFFTNSDVF